MPVDNPNAVHTPVKDGSSERPIPLVWQATIKEIVKAFVQADYQLSVSVPGVAPVSIETATQIQNYLHDYGATLTELPEETWNSSVCIWMGSRWDLLIDLWTISEGRSDLVLSLQVFEEQGRYVFHIYMVYVP